jgi:hypothetical protein
MFEHNGDSPIAGANVKQAFVNWGPIVGNGKERPKMGM